MKISLFSFGFKHGVQEADMLLDVRFLPNPYWVPELREHAGLEKPVADYVLENECGREFMRHLEPLFRFMLCSHRQKGRKEFCCAIGCTGGRHRSVAVVERLLRLLAAEAKDDEVLVRHRDIDKEQIA